MARRRPFVALEALHNDAETLGIEIRAGIHTGECELLDADIGDWRCISPRGSSARPTPAKSSSPEPCDLVVGSGTSFEDRGRSNCVGCRAVGNFSQSIAKGWVPIRPKRFWRPRLRPALGPRCVEQTARWR